ncbi:MAG: primosomal protein N' [Wenzhouxiangellaceae bacterium]
MIYRVAVNVPLWTLLDYHSTEQFKPGQVVQVPLGGRRATGLIVDILEHSPHQQLKSIHKALPVAALPDELTGLLRWCWRYYHHPPGEVVAVALPPALASTRIQAPAWYRLTTAGRELAPEQLQRAPRQQALLAMLRQAPLSASELSIRQPGWQAVMKRLLAHGWCEVSEQPPAAATVENGPELREEQALAVREINASNGGYCAWLLDGVTGSGKTEVYLHAARHTLSQGRQVLLLVPEIGLTPQTLQRVSNRLDCAVDAYHSGMADGARRLTWDQVASGRTRVVVGTRSAVFLPFTELGLIVVDEEHDASYKQQEGFHYSARDVAVMRAHRLQIPIVLGSATPSLETLANARRQRYRTLHLRQRQGEAAPWRLIDMRGIKYATFSPAVLSAIAQTLNEGGQVMLFRNRRGYAPVLMCAECGWSADCRRCAAHLTWHLARRRLICHHCGAEQARPPQCPECGSEECVELGQGTERLEEQLQSLFPQWPVHRVDRDRMRRRDAMDQLRAAVLEGQPCILVGTQMLAKGHDFPNLRLVIVVDADQALHSADFRAPERLGQLLVQVAGRAGRSEHPGEVMIQTLQPEDPLLVTLLQQGYPGLAERLLSERESASLPPYSAQAMLRADAADNELPQRFLHQAIAAVTQLPAAVSAAVSIMGPFPAVMERRAGRWRWQLCLQSDDRGSLNRFLDRWLVLIRDLPETRQLRWRVDVDPSEL